MPIFSQLFGEDEDAGGELDAAEKQGENGVYLFACCVSLIDPHTNLSAQEIATLRKEAQAFKAVRAALRSPATTGDAARMVFQKVRSVFAWPDFTSSHYLTFLPC